MMDVPIYKLSGEQADTLRLDERLLGTEIRPALLKQAYVMYHANKRQGSATVRNRGKVNGSGRKLYRQKGTGRARRGPVRTNIMRGGGAAFVKEPKSWRQRMPLKMRRLAARNALLAKAVDGEIKVVEEFAFDKPGTRQFAGVVRALGINRTCLLALAEGDRNTALSARNVPDVQCIQMDQLNAYDLLSRRFLLVDRPTLAGWLDARQNGAGAAGEAA